MLNLLRRFFKLPNAIYNIPLSCCFVDVLAAKLEEEFKNNLLDMADVLILLPNRRACKTLADAFVKRSGLRPTLLPRMMPIGDVEEDDLVLSGQNSGQQMAALSPAISVAERLMLFTKIIMSRPSEYGLERMSLGQACRLAQELGRLIDTVQNEELDFAALQNLVTEEYAAHWQDTLKFLEIITAFWPQILQERDCVDPAQRRNQLLAQQCEIWTANPPQQRIILAGTTATFPEMKKLAKVISELPQGQIVLAGLDKNLDEESWIEVDETHPQFELKELLDFLQLKREEVIDWCEPANREREKLIAEVMRPAVTTDKWRELAQRKINKEALQGIKRIECDDVRSEALAIALVMRETLETPEKTAALVTPDRNLARRVADELARWKIKVDDSAGCPLSLTPLGSFLRLSVAAALPQAKRIDKLSLLKHPLCGLGKSLFAIRQEARNLEKNVWRAGLSEDDELRTEIWGSEWLKWEEFLQQPQIELSDLITRHLQIAEVAAATDEEDGANRLWKGDAGDAAATFMAEWLEHAKVLGAITVNDYIDLLNVMLGGITVRPKYGTHPRLKILGPIEARLNRFDIMIVGEVNESVWPVQAASDPWMSRPMKRDFGYPQPEKNIGVAAQDFCSLLAAETVYLTRAERVQGTPMVKSRWLMRLETVIKALELEEEKMYDYYYGSLAEELDNPRSFAKINPPSFCPPVAARPRELSASGIEMLMRDPYGVLAKYILRLKPLEEIEPDLTKADYGTIIHGILEEFNSLNNRQFPQNAKEQLLALGRQKFQENNLAAETKAFWWPEFEKSVEWLVKAEQEYRQGIKEVHNEVCGQMSWQAPAGEFRVTAKADRVDETTDGCLNIIDYKTGSARTPKEVKLGYAPQLPIEALIAQKGGFSGIKAAEVQNLIYWQLGKGETIINENLAEILERNEQNIRELIALFDLPTTPYLCHPNPKHIPQYSDYEHLARVKEWSVQSDDND